MLNLEYCVGNIIHLFLIFSHLSKCFVRSFGYPTILQNHFHKAFKAIYFEEESCSFAKDSVLSSPTAGHPTISWGSPPEGVFTHGTPGIRDSPTSLTLKIKWTQFCFVFSMLVIVPMSLIRFLALYACLKYQRKWVQHAILKILPNQISASKLTHSNKWIHIQRGAASSFSLAIMSGINLSYL